MSAIIFAVIAPVFLCAAVGVIWARRGVAFETEFVTRLVTNVGFPCLIFFSLVKMDLDWTTFGQMAFASLITTLAFGLAAAPMLRAAKLDLRAFLPSMMFANTGNMGLPLCLLAFGEEGLALAISYFVVSALLLFALGPAISSRSARITEAFRTPLIWSTLAALAVMYLDLPVPAWLMKTIELLGGFAIPLMLITLGVSLAELKWHSLPRSLGLALLRLGMGFLVGWGTAHLMGLEGAARGVLIIECAMPVAVFNYLYAQKYETQPVDVAGAIVVSTALGFATLPALLWFIL